MPVDPALESTIAASAAAGAGALEELSVDEARAVTSALGAGRQSPPVASIEQRTIDGVRARLYCDHDVDDAAPILVWLHGGGFVVGDLDRAEPTACRFARALPVRVVSVDYRLAPEHPYPAALDDCRAVLGWAIIQSVPVAIGGDSAGANLAALLAIEARDRGTRLAHQLLVYPCADLAMAQPSIEENAHGYVLTRSTLSWFYAQYLPVGVNPRDSAVSPLYADDLSGVAPATIVTAEFDPLRDEGNSYATRLTDAGVEVDAVCYPGMIHGFFNMVGVTPVAEEANERAFANLRRALRGGGVYAQKLDANPRVPKYRREPEDRVPEQRHCNPTEAVGNVARRRPESL